MFIMFIQTYLFKNIKYILNMKFINITAGQVQGKLTWCTQGSYGDISDTVLL